VEKKTSKGKKISFVNFAIPVSMPNNIPISPIIENNCFIVKNLPIF